MKELTVGNKMMVEIPSWLREMQPQYGEYNSVAFYTELAKWINSFETKDLEFLCVDYYGVCWFKINIPKA
jgi:hypothetical protein